MKVLVVSVVHTPTDARIHHRQIRAMRDNEMMVTQVGPWSDTGTDPASGVPGVVAVDVPRASGRSRFAALRRARRIILDLGPRHDVVLLHDPELVLAVVGRLHRLPPVVLDVHEDLGASLRDRAWLPWVLRRPAAAAGTLVEHWAERHLAALFLAEHRYQDRFEQPHLVVPNLPWRPVTTALDEEFRTDRVVHLGRLSMGRGARELLAVGARLAADAGPRLELIGPADADVAPLLQAAQERGDVVWHGFLPNDRALRIVVGSLAGLAPLHDLPNYRVSLPTKIAEYLAHGVPPIVTPLPESVRMVTESGCGVVVPFGDVDETVEAIRGLAVDPHRRAAWGRAARDYIATSHSWDAFVPQFIQHLRAIGEPSKSSRAPGAAGAGTAEHQDRDGASPPTESASSESPRLDGSDQGGRP